jgi:hypothetical protein
MLATPIPARNSAHYRPRKEDLKIYTCTHERVTNSTNLFTSGSVESILDELLLVHDAKSAAPRPRGRLRVSGLDIDAVVEGDPAHTHRKNNE